LNSFDILPITIKHTIENESLEFIHKDPFDRILVSQAISEKLVIITIDENIKKYGVTTLW
jgi:PIN domain nuclease of toxin-antitoxin system